MKKNDTIQNTWTKLLKNDVSTRGQIRSDNTHIEITGLLFNFVVVPSIVIFVLLLLGVGQSCGGFGCYNSFGVSAILFGAPIIAILGAIHSWYLLTSGSRNHGRLYKTYVFTITGLTLFGVLFALISGF